jgi:hypothetical protein
MNISKFGFPSTIQLFSLILIASLVVTLLSACSPQVGAGLTEPSPTSETLAEPTLTPIPTLPPFDKTTVRFEEGQHTRNEYCSRIFDTHETTYGALTISIADNLVEQKDLQQLAGQVVDRYTELFTFSSVFMNRPITVFILSNPTVGECYSRDDLVFVEPEELDSRVFMEDLLGTGSGNSKYWVRSGLASLVMGEKPDQTALQSWYETTDDLDMAGLFFARFHEDWTTEEERQIARMSAASLVQYALEVEAIQPDKLVEQINNDVRTRWLASLRVDRAVTYPYDGQYNGFIYFHNSQCSLVILTDTIHYCLNNLPEGYYIDEVPELEFMINQTYYGRKVLVNYLLTNAPSISHLMPPDETISFKIIEHRNALGFAGRNTVVVNSAAAYYYGLHEIVHTFNWNLNMVDIWLAEGFAEYLGKYLSIYPPTQTRCIYAKVTGHLYPGVVPEVTSCYLLDAEQFEAVKVWYVANEGQLEPEEAIDPFLYANAVSFATIYRDSNGSLGIPIGVKYEKRGSGWQDGYELSYTQVASFVAWLCDTYTIDRVLDVFVNSSENGKLDGKTYEELKTAWQAYLISMGEGIAIPGAP